MQRDGDGFIARAAQIDGGVDGLRFERIVKLDPLNSARGFELVVVVVAAIGGGATERSEDAYEDADEPKV